MRPSLYRKEMFEKNGLADLHYPIALQDASLYEKKLKTNFNIFTFNDADGKERAIMFTSRRAYLREANLLYWNGYYAPIANIERLFSDYSKGKRHHHMCVRCKGVATMGQEGAIAPPDFWLAPFPQISHEGPIAVEKYCKYLVKF